MSFLYFFHVPAFHFPSCCFITILIIFSFSTCVSAYFQEMVVLCLVPFVKACCLSQRTAVHPYFTSLLPTTNYPSPPCRAGYSSFVAARVVYPCSQQFLVNALRYRHRLFPSFRTPVPVRFVCVFTVCSSSFIIHAPLLLGHVQP